MKIFLKTVMIIFMIVFVQIFFKLGFGELNLTSMKFPLLLKNHWIVLGGIIYLFLNGMTYFFNVKIGVDTFALGGLIYFFVAILATMIIGEYLSPLRWGAICLISIGAMLITWEQGVS